MHIKVYGKKKIILYNIKIPVSIDLYHLLGLQINKIQKIIYNTSIGEHSRYYNTVPPVNTVLSEILRVLLNEKQINE